MALVFGERFAASIGRRAESPARRQADCDQRRSSRGRPPSGLNQVERWFALLTRREIRRGSFASAKDLVARITAFVAIGRPAGPPSVT
jgi:hypothetical protein